MQRKLLTLYTVLGVYVTVPLSYLINDTCFGSARLISGQSLYVSLRQVNFKVINAILYEFIRDKEIAAVYQAA